MSENVAPNPSANGDTTRGLPYYEKLRKDLRETLQKKRLLDKNIVSDFKFSFWRIDLSQISLT